MNTAHWHLILNHLPIVGIVVGIIILISGYILKNNSIVKQTALGVLFFSALTAIPAYITGEGAEETVENISGVSESIIEAHEDMGKIFLIVVLILGALSFITFFANWFQSKYSPLLFILILTIGIGTCFLAKQVGTSGGEIRHTEIRTSKASQIENTLRQSNEAEKDDD